jgi:hypothetical protein
MLCYAGIPHATLLQPQTTEAAAFAPRQQITGVHETRGTTPAEASVRSGIGSSRKIISAARSPSRCRIHQVLTNREWASAKAAVVPFAAQPP